MCLTNKYLYLAETSAVRRPIARTAMVRITI